MCCYCGAVVVVAALFHCCVSGLFWVYKPLFTNDTITDITIIIVIIFFPFKRCVNLLEFSTEAKTKQEPGISSR